MSTEMKSYHYAWLSAHPTWTVDCLRAALRAGFDVHHLDGDPTNNDPGNLVLIENADHKMLHGGSRLNRIGRMPREQSRELDRRCYEIFATGDPNWIAAAEQLGLRDPWGRANRWATWFNRAEGLRIEEEGEVSHDDLEGQMAEYRAAGLRALGRVGT